MLPSRAVPVAVRPAYRLDRKASLFAGVYSGSIFPFVGVIARGVLHASGFEISVMTAAPFVGYLLAIFYANAVEGKRKVRSMVAPFFLCRLILFLMMFATTSWTFVLLLAAAQVVAGLAGPATAAVLKEIYPDDCRGRIMSYNRVAFTLSGAMVALPVGWLLKQEAVGYRVIFPVAAVVGMIGSAIYLRIEDLYRHKWPPEPPPVPWRERIAWHTVCASATSTLRFLRDTFGIFQQDINYRWFALSVFTYGFGNLMIGPLIPIYQVDRLHITTAQLGLLTQIAQVAMIFAYFYWGRYVDLKSPLRAVVVNVLLNALIPLVYFFSGNVWHLVPAFVLQGITNAGIDLSYFNSILTFANEENAARYQALHSFLLGIRGTLAPFAGVAILHALEQSGTDVKYLFLVGLVLILAGCWMQVVGVRTRYELDKHAPSHLP